MRLISSTGAVLLTAVLVYSTNAVCASPETNRKAYEATLKCFVVEGSASGGHEDAGDRNAQALGERAAHRSFDLVMKFGKALGYTGRRIDADMELAQVKELPKLVSDAGYRANAEATCKALGLSN